VKVSEEAEMNSKTTHPEQDHDHSAAHGCCGSRKQAVKQEKKDTGCGCGDKQVKEAKASSCCG
jgi:hypothetical protein